MLGDDMDYSGAVANFAYTAPDDRKPYLEFFSPCAVHFNAERSELKIPEAWLSRPLTTGNVLMSSMTAARCDRLMGPY